MGVDSSVRSSDAPGKALVLGSDMGGFLGVVRSLGRRGIEVHVAWCPDCAPARRSRYVHRSHHLPRPTVDGDWIPAFRALLERERFDLVVATDDPTLIPLQLHRAELEASGRLYLLDERSFSITFDKVKTRELAEAHGIPVAAGEIVSDATQIDAALASRDYPLVIKPQASFSFEDLERRNSVARVYTETEAREAISERLHSGKVIVEQNVNGSGWGVEVLAAQGAILLVQQHERLHEPLHGGASSYRRTVPVSGAFMHAVRRLLSDLRYTGVAMFEFKGEPGGKGEIGGDWILVEINGRFWGSLPLSLSAGIDFPYALWQLLVGGGAEVVNEYETNVYARNLKRDLKWLWLNLRADRTDPVLATRTLSQVVGELRHIVSGREHADQFTIDDPAPGVAELVSLAFGLLDHVRAQLVAHTPARRLVRRRARTALRTAGSVLFVCYGNICRSPFAAALARRRLPASVEVASAGLAIDAGRRSPAIAREIAREFGVDLEGHRSIPVTPEVVARADAIFAFDERNLRELRHRHPELRQKLHLVGALGPGPLIVSDPLNGDEVNFRRIYGTIADALSDGR